jgi:predicted solute-binding protein
VKGSDDTRHRPHWSMESKGLALAALCSAVLAFQHALNYAGAAAAGVAAAGFMMVVFLLPARPRADGTQPGPASAESVTGVAR